MSKTEMVVDRLVGERDVALERAARLEQQLAAVTAALKAAGVDHVGSLTEQVIRLAADRDGHHANLQRIRDELNHDVWRLEEERDKLRVEAQRISAEYAQYRNTAEVERDELRREVERLKEEYRHTRIADLEKQLAEGEALYKAALENIRKGQEQLAEERRAAEQNHLAACQEKDRAENLTRQLAEQAKRAGSGSR